MINVFSYWNNVVATDVTLIMYVAPNTGKEYHTNRQYHGIVMNDSTSKRNYYFADGTVLKTRENDVFYLPKGSTYRVKSIVPGGCYAINFIADINDTPFNVSPKNPEIIRKIFKDAEKNWINRPSYFKQEAFKNLYDLIICSTKEEQAKYTPSSSESIIFPAVEHITSNFTDCSLKISEMAKLCNISEAYFRRLFINKYGISPKEYILQLRIDYAQKLLLSGEISIQEIASSSGFTEPCHFSREFKKRTNFCPREFLKRNIQNKE